MSRATPHKKALAERLIAFETTANQFSDRKAPASFYVLMQLQTHLAGLVGTVGYRALLSRALAVAKPDASWVSLVKVKADGSLETSENHEAALDQKEIDEGNIALIAHLIGILVAFIGEILTLRMLQHVWPELSLDGSDLSEPEKNEETNRQP